ncbi:MAG: hypothetical protein UR43_C0022G0008 [candidate division TM6 bacterium GW2011_GWF2_33_332]|nr:MAG: hypothetical protein UR43_C0022G0008 [candidate division TM6 bacterium GW2011_GWF2_33_332]
MGKQQNDNDDLFQNMDISGFESALLDVDQPVTDELDDELSVGDEPGDDEKIKGQPGGGAPGKGQKPVKDKSEPGKKAKDDTLIVDVQDNENPDDDDNKKDTVKPGKDKKGGGAPDEGNESPVYLHAAALLEHGVLPNFDLKSLDGLEPVAAIIKLNEHIQTQIDESIQEGVEEYKSTIGDKAVKFIADLEKGIPFESLADNYSLEERYGSITKKSLAEDEKLQEQVYKDLLTLKGFSEAKINKMVAIAKEKEDLLEEATEGLGEIQSTIEEERKEMRIQAERQKTAKDESIRKTKEAVQSAVKATKEIIPGIEVTEEEKKELIKSLTVPVYFTNKQGEKIPMSAAMAQRAKNPLAFELRLAYFIKNGFFDDKIKDGAFDVFTKKVETSATKRLGSILNGERRTVGKPGSEVNKGKGEKEEKDDFQFPQQFINM